MKYSFKLRRPKSENTSVIFKFYLNKKRFTYSLGPDQTINPKNWNSEKERPNDKKSNLYARIENIITETDRYFALQEKAGLPVDFSELKERLNQLSEVKGIEPQTPKDKIEFEQYLNSFINGITAGKITTRQNKKYSPKTVKSYKLLDKQLNDYKKSRKIRVLKFESFDGKFYKDFQNFMYEQNYSINYFGKIIKNLKRILRQAIADDLHTNRKYEDYVKPSIKADKIALTEQEVQLIYNYEPTSEKERLYRDVFLIQCFTALRLSDAKRIRKKHIVENKEIGMKFIQLKTYKSKTDVSIPINPDLDTVLKQYDYDVPKVTDQKLNYAIKDICKTVGIDNETEITESKGGLTTYKTVPRYELVSSHTGRRTAATNMYRNGIEPLDIIRITGHSTVKMLMNYLKIDHNENAKHIAANPFFQSKNTLRAI